MDESDQRQEHEGATTVGNDAIKWSAIVIIVLAILYFLAKFVVPLFG